VAASEIGSCREKEQLVALQTFRADLAGPGRAARVNSSTVPRESGSPSELGAALDVTCQQIQKYESGVNRVEKFAATLRVPITYFFDRHPPENGHGEGSGQDLTAFLATPEGLALCTAFQMIDSQNRPPARDGDETLSAEVGRRGNDRTNLVECFFL
jgi:hypothetical protein